MQFGGRSVAEVLRPARGSALVMRLFLLRGIARVTARYQLPGDRFL